LKEGKYYEGKKLPMPLKPGKDWKHHYWELGKQRILIFLYTTT
jgi:hypothetical protein